MGAKLKIYDPNLRDKSTVKTLDDALDTECVVLLTDHSAFKNIDFSGYRRIKAIIDGRNYLEKKRIEEARTRNPKILYNGIGR